MTSPNLADLSGRVFLRHMERRGKYRSWGQFFGVIAVLCCIGTFVVPVDPWWARYGFAGLAALSVLGALVALWRLTQYRERRG